MSQSLKSFQGSKVLQSCEGHGESVVETADSTSPCPTSAMQEASASQNMSPGEGEGWGWAGSRVMVGAQCTKEAEITGVCTSLDLLGLEVGWGAGADAAA